MRVLFASLPLAATIVAFLAVPRGFTRLAGVVYSFVLGSFHTKCVGEETISESKKVDRKKKHLKHSPHVWSRFLVSSRQKRNITERSSSDFTQRLYGEKKTSFDGVSFISVANFTLIR